MSNNVQTVPTPSSSQFQRRLHHSSKTILRSKHLQDATPSHTAAQKQAAAAKVAQQTATAR